MRLLSSERAKAQGHKYITPTSESCPLYRPLYRPLLALSCIPPCPPSIQPCLKPTPPRVLAVYHPLHTLTKRRRMLQKTKRRAMPSCPKTRGLSIRRISTLPPTGGLVVMAIALYILIRLCRSSNIVSSKLLDGVRREKMPCV